MSKDLYTVVPIKVKDNEKFCAKDCFFLKSCINRESKLVWFCTAFDESEENYQSLIVVDSPRMNDYISIPRCEQCKENSDAFTHWFMELIKNNSEKYKELYKSLAKNR